MKTNGLVLSGGFRLCLVAGLGAVLLAGSPSNATASPITPVYLESWDDAVTGYNCTGMTASNGCGSSTGWYVNTGADDLGADLYERPTTQTYKSGPDSLVYAEKYYGYLDVTGGAYGYDDSWMYFSIDLFSPYLYEAGKTGSGVEKKDFGSGTLYGVQINDQLLLYSLGNKDALKTSPGAFTSVESFGYCDADGSVPSTYTNGYEQTVISDGKTSGQSLLYYRYYYDPVTLSTTVEIAFNYALYNTLVSPACQLVDPSDVDLVFEATRGLKGQSNYSWNDKYPTNNDAGTPYSTLGLKNIYELDNLRASFQFQDPPPPTGDVPEPATLALLGLALAAGTLRRQTRRK